jgi:hypothetical protein
MSETKKSSPNTNRSVSAKLEKRIAAYMAAAGAAGVTLLGVQPAEAKVVYTKTFTKYQSGGIPIDLNHDGVTDFVVLYGGGIHELVLDVAPQVTGNAVVGGLTANAGFFGVAVGSKRAFTTIKTYYGVGIEMAKFFQYGQSSSLTGPWADVTDRYLGFKFLINGEIHYGWARLTTTNDLLHVFLTGYAYETVPNKTIIEGHTSGADIASNHQQPSPQAASLGMLARGADALALWRRDEEAA